HPLSLNSQPHQADPPHGPSVGCGITRILGNADVAIASSMAACLSHRGPDGSGGFLEESAEGSVAFAHSRLSIVDIDGSSQPIHSDHGAVLIQNGEIYNYTELKAELRAYPWRTSGDSEAILALHKHGTSSHPNEPNHTDWVSRLDGIWGFALWDHGRQELLLCRDPLGVKPLVRAQLPDGTLIFASEVKALQEHPDFSASPDIDALAVRLAYEYPFDMTTLFSGVTQVAPGTIETWALDAEGCATLKSVQRHYKQSRTTADWDPISGPDSLLSSLRYSVESRMISDVPIGVVLSGGLDSSLIAALARDSALNYGNPLPECWTVASSEDNPDFVASELVSEHLDLTHHTEVIEERAFWNCLPRFVYDGEDLDISVLFWQPLFELMSSKVKVGLCGQGADELHGGYSRYKDVAGHSSLIARRLSRYNLDTSLLSTGEGMPWADNNIHPSHHFKNLHGTMDFELQRGQLSNFQLRLADRHGMAQGLEVRVPFLGKQHVQTSNRLPTHMLISDATEKLALREASTPAGLPESIVQRPKLPAGTATTPDLVTSLIEELTPHAMEWSSDYGKLAPMLIDQPDMAIGIRLFHSIHLTDDPSARRSKPIMDLLDDVSPWPVT
ncbi:MAG: asparagine synthase (glutamine-hydrolyzing), partial [Candidatus Thermoplasmatota archaeon]|nr:asparagine synthase (glutamine-hydrolyzing) [Candidatus Thermoplasmatota archaeon]